MYVGADKSTGCWSFIGKCLGCTNGLTASVTDWGAPDGFQIVSLSAGCEPKGTVQHETLHALGTHHEQVRPDRDQYVEIHQANIQESSYDVSFQLITIYYIKVYYKLLYILLYITVNYCIYDYILLYINYYIYKSISTAEIFHFRRQPITVPYFHESLPLIGYRRKWNISAIEVD